MQLPRQVIIGDGVLNNTTEFIKENILKDEKFALITGENVKKKVGSIIEKNFLENNIQYQWVSAGSASRRGRGTACARAGRRRRAPSGCR